MIPITLDKRSDTPLYRQIADQITGAVGTGALGREERLPTTRGLARSLGVNRLTISRAYAELASAGLITSHVGRGTWVTGAPAERAGAGGGEAAAGGEPILWPALYSRLTDRALDADPFPQAHAPRRAASTISFASQFPDPALFPVEPIRRALDHVLRTQGHAVLGYGPPAGHPPLREMIARSLRERGMDVTADGIVVTSGSQQGIDLVARALIEPGDTVLVENPTYTGAVQVFQSFGAELRGVPVDEEGIVVPLLEEAVARHRPKLIYVMPNFQNPTSETMSLRRRRALVDLASARRLAILEDDFGGDLRFEGSELPSLRSLDRGGHVLYMSTFAKKLLPGLRIGWIAAPVEVADRLARLKKITDYSTSTLLQAALHEFCRQGSLERHLSEVIPRYRERRDAMLAAMKRCFPPEAVWSRPQGGLVVWLTLPPGVDAEAIAAAAEARSVLVGRGDLFHVDGGTRQNLRLTFCRTTPREIHRGIRILGDIIKQSISSKRSGRRRPAADALPLI